MNDRYEKILAAYRKAYRRRSYEARRETQLAQAKLRNATPEARARRRIYDHARHLANKAAREAEAL